MSMNNKILMLVNSFPPSGESGVQRPVKFLKYLARDGWETFVITPRNPVMLKNRDVSLEKEVPADTHIFKTSSLGIREDRLTEVRFELEAAKSVWKSLVWKAVKLLNDIIFPIDKQIGWVPFALLKAVQLIRKYRIRNIYITASPFSAFLCGIVLKKIYGSRIFWVADYRDAWQFAPLLQKFVLPFRYRFICRIDEKVLRRADYVTFSSPDVLIRYQEKYFWLQGKSDYITNGYDEDDFTNLIPRKFDKYTFVYMGKLHPVKGNPLPLLKAIKSTMDREFQYLHLGIISQQLLKKIEQEDLSFFSFLGYKPHTEALAFSAGADINVLILNNDSDSAGVIPGKVFELIRLGKPILAAGPPDSVVSEIITSTASGVYACSDIPDEISAALEQLLINEIYPQPDLNFIEQYSRKVCTEKLAAIYLRRAKS